MKIKAILATLIGAVAIQGAVAGTQWVPAAPAKCPVDDCPDIGGNISVGYETDYIFRGVRLARNSVWGDVNYTFENLPFSPTLGVWAISELDEAGVYGDEANFYANAALPSILGFDAVLGYTNYQFFPGVTAAAPRGSQNRGTSHEVSLALSRELFAGIGLSTLHAYDFGQIEGWYHEAALGKAFDLSDALAFDLTAGVGYSDGYNAGGASGWNHYFVQAALPIALNCRSAITPYIGYNGTPDGFVLDGVPSTRIPGRNYHDALHGGVSVSVDF